MKEWQGIVAIILATGVALSLIVLSVSDVFHDGHVTAEESTLLATALGAAIGAIATAMGQRSKEKE
jgi:hypothetical protein